MSKKIKIKVCKFSAKDAAMIEKAMQLRDLLEAENSRLRKEIKMLREKLLETEFLLELSKPADPKKKAEIQKLYEETLKGGAE